MTNEIEKQTTGQSRNLLIKMWQEDCTRNEEISRKRWDNKNLVWLTKYAESFRLKHQDKNPFIRISDDTDKKKTYAEATAMRTQVRRPQQNISDGQNQVSDSYQRLPPTSTERPQSRQNENQQGGQALRQPRPQRPPRYTRPEEENQRQPSPRNNQEDLAANNWNRKQEAIA